MNWFGSSVALSPSAQQQLWAERKIHGSALTRGLFWGVPLAVLLSGVFLGGDLPWAQALVASLVYPLFAVGLLLVAVGHVPGPKLSNLHKVFFAVFLAVALLVEWQSAQSVGWSMVPSDTERQANVTWLLLAFSACCVLYVRNKTQLNVLLWSLLLIGLLHVVAGVVLFASGASYDFRGDQVSHNVVKGLFINRNNFAAFINLTLGVGIGLMLQQIAQTQSAGGTGFRRFMRNLSDFFLSAKAPLRIILMALVIGLIASRSRSANGLFFMSTLFLGVSALWLFKRGSEYAKKSVKVLFVTVIAFDVIVLGSVIGLDRLIERFEKARVEQQVAVEREKAEALNSVSEGLTFQPSRQTETFGSRINPAWGVLQGMKEAPLLGTGLGSFRWIFPEYKDANSIDGFYKYAHSDPLQFLLEAGALGAGLFALLALIPTSQAWLVFADKKRRTRTRALALGLFTAIALVLLHSAVDFPLQIFGVVLPLVLVFNAIFLLDLPSIRPDVPRFSA